jgi:hypothetical protein
MEAKVAVGDKVDQSPRDKFVGTVSAVFTTKGYAVDAEGHGTLEASTPLFLTIELRLAAYAKGR